VSTNARRIGWSAVVLLAAAAVALAPRADRSREGRSPAARLLGPFADLASDVQWIRFRRALIRGDEARALRLAESALALDPRATDGWELLAWHLGFFLASPDREPDLARRRAWFDAALDVAREGARRAEHPAEMHLLRGLLFQTKAQLDPAIAPGGARALWRQAAEAFAEANAAGRADAVVRERHAREQADDQ